ncbi:membrane bound O-acyl transferase family-domain-containing protein [Mycena capillaripes]|nr:membrane bound O-acyl transferase family-domain-containing protein [Mycena capillaripes]
MIALRVYSVLATRFMRSLLQLDELFDLSHRKPLTLASFFHTFLLPVGLYYVTNVLAILGPRTFFYRLALLPVTVFMAYRGAVSLDVAKGFLATNPSRLDHMNQFSTLAMFTVLTRSLARTFSSQTPRRRDIAQSTVMTPGQVALEAVDLTLNLRSCGWNFAANTKLPAHTRPLTPTSAYLTATAKSLVGHIIAFDFLHYSSQLLSPHDAGSTVGGSIYDTTISDPLTYYARSTLMTVLVGLLIYGAIHIGNDAFSVVGITIFRQSPSDWPPIFDAPWRATSLTDFWAARWHQIFRQDFIAIGGKPLALVTGRVGAVLGAFFVSGILHFVGLWGLGNGTDIRVIYFFLMMGVGVILEEFWRRFSGRRVGGWLGWVWCISWVVGFGPLMADPWCLSGIMGSVFIPQPVRPAVLLHKLAKSISQSYTST